MLQRGRYNSHQDIFTVKDGIKAMGVIAVRLGRLRVCRNMEPTTVDQSGDLKVVHPRSEGVSPKRWKGVD